MIEGGEFLKNTSGNKGLSRSTGLVQRGWAYPALRENVGSVTVVPAAMTKEL